MIKSILTVVSMFVIVLLMALPVKAQKVLQYSAEILSADSTSAIAYATVFDRKTGQGSYSNQQGFFSIVVLAGDSIEISSVGYHKLIVVIPTDAHSLKLSETLYMYPEKYNLKQVTILPFTRDEFRYAFVYGNVPHDDLTRAYANLNPAVLRRISRDLPRDGREQASLVMHQYASTYYYMGQRQPMNVLNPIAWYEFFKTLREGGFKDQSDK